MTQYFAKSHECFQLNGDIALVSLTEYAVDQLGEITYVQLPSEGDNFSQGDVIGEVESVKTVSEIYAPVSGTVVKVNTELDEEPELLNEDLANRGWLIHLKLTAPEELENCLDSAAYQTYIDGLA